MKIAIVTSTFKPELSGIAETVNKRVREISRIGGHEILILGPDYSKIRNVLPDFEKWVGPIYDGVRVEVYPTTEYKNVDVKKTDTLHPVHFWQCNIDQQLERFAPDVIHVDEPERFFGMRITDGYTRRVGLRYARRRGIPITAMWHTDYLKYATFILSPTQAKIAVPIATRLIAWVFNSYDLTICNSEEALRGMRKIGVRNARFFRSVGIDMENFRPLEKNRKEDFLELPYVGRVTPEKSLPVLLDAFQVLEKRHPRVRLRVVGDGPSLEDLRAKYSGPRLTFDGKIDNAELPRVYNAADIFINPSDTETFTQTALEAAACGLPIVVAAGGGNFETVREGVNGEFFEPRSVQALVEKLERLITDPDLRRRYAEESPRLAEPFRSPAVAQSFLDLWESLLAQKR